MNGRSIKLNITTRVYVRHYMDM